MDIRDDRFAPIMIFNKDVLFIHVPKTGGMAVSEVLLQALPKPLHYSHPHRPDPRLAARGIVEFPGSRHETAAMCREAMARHGYDIGAVKLVLAVVRDPYEIEVSRFAYLQNGNAWDSGSNQELALDGDFEAFARASDDHGGGTVPIEEYFELDGERMPALRVLRQEDLAEDLRAALASVGIDGGPALRRLNTSRHGAVHGYYTPGAEEAVFRRYRWIFEHGYYSRLDPGMLPAGGPRRRFNDTLALDGPVERLGLARDCWEDTWVGETLRFPARLTAPVRGVRLAGGTPERNTAPTELVLRLGRREFAGTFPPARSFEWEVACPFARHEALEVELRAGPTFCPHAVEPGSPDRRALAFRLLRFEFLSEDGSPARGHGASPGGSPP